MVASVTAVQDQTIEFETLWRHPKPLWMLFMAEFWERFAFYGIRWALTLYIVSQFFNGDASGQQYASNTYGAYLALVYAGAIFGGYVADKIIGYQHSILLGAVFMGAGLFMLMLPNQNLFLLGLATVIVGNGLFKPIISTLVGKVYAENDPRKDRGFSIFYMGINAGAMISPIFTNWLAATYTNTPMEANYKLVFAAAGVGMVISYIWFYIGRKQLKGIGAIEKTPKRTKNLVRVALGCVAAIAPTYYLMAYAGSTVIAWLLLIMFIVVCFYMWRGAKEGGSIATDRVLAMLAIFIANVIFWVFFEQAGSSLNFLAQNIVVRDITATFEFPIAWFQSVNSVAILMLAPVLTLIWVHLSKRNAEPNIPRKFAIGILITGLGFAVLMYALHSLVNDKNMIPFWTLIACYVLHTVGELCLSPVGLAMVSKLVPSKMAGMAFGGWFLSVAIGNNLSGIFAGSISGEHGMTVTSAYNGFSFAFLLLLGGGVLLYIISPQINKLMHGVK